jgi:hypothetical protein
MFLLAMVTSITGGALIQGLPDSRVAVTVGVALELVNPIAVLGIVAALWVPLSRSHPALTAGYLGVRVLEAAVCAAAAMIPLVQLSLTQRDEVLDAVRATLVGVGVPVFFGAGATILYLVLYRSRLVPRFIAIWGLVGAAAILANVVISNPAMEPVLALPIIANEIFLGIYLLAKGLRAPVPAV